MVKDLRPIKTVDNVAMINSLRRELSLDFQHRVPEVTQANFRSSIENLTEYSATFNEFAGALVNRIGLVYARRAIWENPLATFKRGMLTYGDTIEEIYTGLLEARVYDPDRENQEKILFGTESPTVEANFHRVNRQEFYKFTVNEDLLKRAFLEPNGLQEFVSTLMAAPTTSDNWDEFLLTTKLFSEYEKNGGFYHVNVPDITNYDSDGADARLTLRKIRAMADTLRFPSTRYNAAKMPVFANPDELVLFATPKFKAAIDVEALAAAFNIDRANVEQKIVTIPEEHFRVDGAQAVLTTDDFFVIADQKIETTSQINPASLHTNYFLHHWEVISCSRFAPAVMFWDGADDEVITIQSPVAAVTPIVMTDVDGDTVTTGQRGFIYQATSAANTAAPVTDKGVDWSVTGNGSPRTRITPAGVLHISPNEPNAKLTVTATSLVVSATDVYPTATATFTVTGEASPDWPVGAGAGEDETP